MNATIQKALVKFNKMSAVSKESREHLRSVPDSSTKTEMIDTLDELDGVSGELVDTFLDASNAEKEFSKEKAKMVWRQACKIGKMMSSIHKEIEKLRKMNWEKFRDRDDDDDWQYR
jgi:hypothetical protein